VFEPKYKITEKIVNDLSKIAEIKGIVERATLIPAREAFLRKVAVIKMAHTSTSIEGNLLNEAQVGAVVEGKKVTAQPNQVLEVVNYLSALKQIDRLAEKSYKFDIQDILAVHKTVTNGLVDKEKSGVFRPGEVYIVNIEPGGKEEVAYTPPPSKSVYKLIEELLSWLHNQKAIHPVIRAGLFHYQFVTIHPFTDGNGRVARLLTMLYLYQSGWDFKRALVLEDYYNRDRKSYYENLQTAETYKKRENIDLTNWLEYYVGGFSEEVEKLREQILVLSAIGGNELAPQVLDKDELKIVDFVTTVGRLTSQDAVDILEIPKRTAQDKLKKLVEKGVLVKKGKGPATDYIIASKDDN
jgi:Fic family protein